MMRRILTPTLAIVLALTACGSALSIADVPGGPRVLSISDSTFAPLPPGEYRTSSMFLPVIHFTIDEPGWFGTQRSTGSWQVKKTSGADRDDGIIVEVDYSTLSLTTGILRFRTIGGLQTSKPRPVTLDGHPAKRMEGISRWPAQLRNPVEGLLIPAGERHVAIGARINGVTIFIYIGADQHRYERLYPDAQRVVDSFRIG